MVLKFQIKYKYKNNKVMEEIMGYMIGVDVGGTFTDFTIFNTENENLYHYKQSSTPDDPSRSIVNGIMHILEEYDISPSEVEYLAHGTTVATNALIEKKGSKIGLITTKGFRDLMEIGNQKRPSLYNLLKQKPESLILPGLKCEVEERILFDGTVRVPLNENDVREAVEYLKAQGVNGIAVCTLFSFINPAHENRIKEIINEIYPEAYTTISHELVSEFREYPRMSTTVLNTYLGPIMKNYVNNFKLTIKEVGINVEPYVTQSNGSIISISETIDSPIKTALSGPSAGVVGSLYIGKNAGIDKIITFDMGGTSADISLIENGQLKISHERYVQGYPARIPMIDINAVGAGGGSIAYIDEGGALKVGPKSAGAVPGPACYKRGGTLPTVTDANIVLGKLNQTKILGGRMDVDIELAKIAIKNKISEQSSLSIEDAAAGIISVVNSNMVRAIRVVSVEKGYDTREFTLMAFGGAGPIHSCEIATSLGIKKVLIPPSPGTLCSLGLLMADTRFDFSASKIMIANKENIDDARSIFNNLYKKGNEMLNSESIDDNDRIFEYVVDCRYERQNYEIPITISKRNIDDSVIEEIKDKFNNEHFKLYGYSDKFKNIQMVNYRLAAIGIIVKPDLKPLPIAEDLTLPKAIEVRKVRFESTDYIDTNIYNRNDLPIGSRVIGPAIIEQMDSTCIIPKDWVSLVDQYSNLIVTFEGVLNDEEN